MIEQWRPGYPACASTPEEDGANFIPPVMANTVVPAIRRLREAQAFNRVAKETALFHERKARKYGVDNPRGLAHFKAAKAYRESAGRLQEMFENGGEVGELPPKAIMRACRAAVAFHKKCAEKAGLDSDEGHAHIAELEHQLDIINKAKKQQEAAPGHGAKQSPVPVPNKSDQPSEDIRQQVPPVPLKQLRDRHVETAGAHAGKIHAGGPGSGPHGHSDTGRTAARFLSKELSKKGMSHRDIPDVTSYKKESSGSRGPFAGLARTFPSKVSSQLRKQGGFAYREKRGAKLPNEKFPKAAAPRVHGGGKKANEADGMVGKRYDSSHDEGFVDHRYPEMKGNLGHKESRKRVATSMGARINRESRGSGGPQTVDSDAGHPAVLGYERPKRGKGWGGGGLSYSPPVSEQPKGGGVEVKEF